MRLTYAQLAPEVDRYARGFVAAGVGAGERVAVWAPNCAEWMLAALGALRAGAVLVPLNTRFKGAEAAYILRNAGATTLRHGPGLPRGRLPRPAGGRGHRRAAAASSCCATRVTPPPPARRRSRPSASEEFLAAGDAVEPADTAARAAAVGPDDVSDLIFTSGTTGHPKGAATTHAQSLRTFGTWSSIVGLGAGDRYLVVNPFFHTFGYKAGILACLMAGATVVPEPVFDAGAVMARIARGAHQRAARAAHPVPDAPGGSRAAPTTTSRRSGSGSPARPWCRSSWCRPCATSSASRPSSPPTG